MKELSNDLFVPLTTITIFIVIVYYIKSDPEKWYTLPNPTNSCACPPVRDIPVNPESEIAIVNSNTVGIPPLSEVGLSALPVNAIIPAYQSYNRDYRVLNDPLYPPEQRSDSDYYYPREIVRNIQYGQGNYIAPMGRIISDNPQIYGNGNFRYPTRGYPPPYQMKGYLVDNNNPDNIISLFGRPKYLGSSQFQYYVSKRDFNNNEIKIDINHNKELYGGENVKIKKDIFKGDYKFVEYKTEELIQPPIF